MLLPNYNDNATTTVSATYANTTLCQHYPKDANTGSRNNGHPNDRNTNNNAIPINITIT